MSSTRHQELELDRRLAELEADEGEDYVPPVLDAKAWDDLFWEQACAPLPRRR